MKHNSNTNRLKRCLMAGIASVSFLAIGCGGSDNTVVPPTISNQGSTGVASLLLSNGGQAGVQIVSTDGTVVSTGTLTNGSLTVANTAAVNSNAYYSVVATSGVTDTIAVPVLAKGSTILNPLNHLQFSAKGIAKSYLIQQDAGFVGSLGTTAFTTPTNLDTKLANLETAMSTAGSLMATLPTAINSLAASYFVTNDARQPAFNKLMVDYLNNPSAKFSYAKAQTGLTTGDFSDFNASLGRTDARFAASIIPFAFPDVMADIRRMNAAAAAHAERINREVAATRARIEAMIRSMMITPFTARTTPAFTQKVATVEIVNNARKLAELGDSTVSTAADNMLTGVLASTDANGNITTFGGALDAVQNNLATVATAVTANENLAQGGGLSLGSLIGGVVQNDSTRSVANVAEVVAQASATAKNIINAGVITAAANSNATISANTLSVVQRVGGLNSNAGIGNVIANALGAVQNTVGRQIAQVANVVATTLNTSTDATLKNEVSTYVNTVRTNLDLDAASTQSLFVAASKTLPFEVKLADVETPVKLNAGTSKVIEFVNDSLDVDKNASYTWSYTASGVTTSNVEMTGKRLKMTVTMPGTNVTAGTVAATLTGAASGETTQTASKTIAFQTDPKFLDILSGSGLTVSTGAVVPVRVFAKYPGATADQTLSVQVGGGTAVTTTVAQADAVAGVFRTLSGTAGSTAGASSVTATFAGVTKTGSITLQAAAVQASILTISGTSFSTGTSAPVMVSVLVKDTFATPATLATTLEILDSTCTNVQAGLSNTVSRSAASVHNFTLSTNVPVGSYCARVTASNGVSTASATETFTVVDASRPQVTGITVAGVGLSSTAPTVITTINTAGSYAVALTVDKALNAGGVSVNQTALTSAANGLSASGSVTLNAGTNTVTVTVTGANGANTYAYEVFVQNTNQLAVTSFAIDGSTLTASTGGGEVTLTTGTAVARNNTLAFKLTTPAQTSGNNASVVFSKITVRLNDVNSSTPRSASATLNNVTLSRTGAGAWSTTATGTLSAEVTRSNGVFATGTKANNEFVGNVANWFTGATDGVTINMSLIRDYLNQEFASNLSNLSTLSGATVRVTVELTPMSGSQATYSGSPFTNVFVNGITVQ